MKSKSIPKILVLVLFIKIQFYYFLKLKCSVKFLSCLSILLDINNSYLDFSLVLYFPTKGLIYVNIINLRQSSIKIKSTIISFFSLFIFIKHLMILGLLLISLGTRRWKVIPAVYPHLNDFTRKLNFRHLSRPT